LAFLSIPLFEKEGWAMSRPPLNRQKLYRTSTKRAVLVLSGVFNRRK